MRMNSSSASIARSRGSSRATAAASLGKVGDAPRRGIRCRNDHPLIETESAEHTFFRLFTPIDELAPVQIGSRPTRRPTSEEDFLRSLRAIPWVFAWTQNRCLLPA
jgi:Phosphoenolpyruvate carboxylase